MGSDTKISSLKKVGIYSGTFDPIHNGHIAFALEAIEQCELDKVYLLIEPRPRRKQGVKAYEHRIAMAQLAIKPYEKLGLIVLDQARFTPRDTMPLLLERFKGMKLCMLMGDDMLDHFSEWPHVDELTESVSFIIGIRKYSEEHINSIALILEQTNGLKLNYQTFKPTEFQLCSSQIKSNIRRNVDLNGLDPEVATYIRQNKLYFSDGE